MRHLASQRFFFHEKQHFYVFVGPYYHFSAFFWIQKDATWNSASIGPNESPWTPIFDHFVQFLIISVPKQPLLKLKSAQEYFAKFGFLWAATRPVASYTKNIPNIPKIILKIYQKYTKNISKIYQNISKIYPRYTRCTN